MPRHSRPKPTAGLRCRVIISLAIASTFYVLFALGLLMRQAEHLDLTGDGGDGPIAFNAEERKVAADLPPHVANPMRRPIPRPIAPPQDETTPSSTQSEWRLVAEYGRRIDDLLREVGELRNRLAAQRRLEDAGDLVQQALGGAVEKPPLASSVVKDPGTTSPTAVHPPTRFPPHQYNPAYDHIAIAVKSGADVAAGRTPIQLLTFLRDVRNVLVVGEAKGIKVAEMEVVDVVTDAYEEAQRRVGGTTAAGADSTAVAGGSNSSGPQEKLDDVNEDSATVANEVADIGGADPGDSVFGVDGVGVESDLASGSDMRAAQQPLKQRRGTDGGTTGAAAAQNKNKVQADERSQGWRHDAHKNLPGLRAMWHAFPDADWYVMIDDDSYVLMENFAAYLAKKDPAKAIYTGLANVFRGCDGVKHFGEGPYFVHGGSGIVVSKGAMNRMLEIVDKCIVRYKPCWAGDVRVGLCMRDAGILAEFGTGFHKEPPTSDFRFPSDKCHRPNVFHHMLPRQIQHLYELETTAKASRQNLTMSAIFAQFVVRPDMITAAGGNEREIADAPPEAGYAFRNEDAPGGDYTRVAAETYAECAGFCAREERCVAWALVGATCWLKDTFVPRKARDGAWSGYLPLRYTC